MKTYFIDTNIFLRFFLKDVPAQFVKAREFFEEAKRGECKIIVCQAVIFEIEFGLRKYYGLDKKDIVQMIGTILNMPYLETEDWQIFQEALVLYANKNWDLVDCFLTVKADQAKAEVLSFDKKIKK
ncbi:MAG: PIN domain-containing protein [Patescibacteria group bacterium]|nr:PIN domain-containing protein [Patescibacteria group bacterium]MCL5432446.1 PIN domain-containing protein [Patescibacteria group bacterium]